MHGAKDGTLVLVLIAAFQFEIVVTIGFILFCQMEWGMDFLSLRLENREGLRRCLTDYHGHTLLDDASLLGGNLCQRVPQELSVVERYVGDDGEHWRDDIRAIESSAQSYLNNGYVYMLLSKILEGHRSGQFEERRVQRLEESTLVLNKFDDVFFAHHQSVNPNPFTEIYKVGRRIESHFIAS